MRVNVAGLAGLLLLVAGAHLAAAVPCNSLSNCADCLPNSDYPAGEKCLKCSDGYFLYDNPALDPKASYQPISLCTSYKSINCETGGPDGCATCPSGFVLLTQEIAYGYNTDATDPNFRTQKVCVRVPEVPLQCANASDLAGCAICPANATKFPLADFYDANVIPFQYGGAPLNYTRYAGASGCSTSPTLNCATLNSNTAGCATCPADAVKTFVPSQYYPLTAQQCSSTAALGCATSADGVGCTSCPDGRYFFQDISGGVLISQAFQALPINPVQCLGCEQNLGCTSCTADKGCTTCPSGAFLASQSNNSIPVSQCKSCAKELNCNACNANEGADSTLTRGCTSCPDGFFRAQGTVPDPTQGSVALNLCINATTAQCVSFKDDTGCTACAPGFFKTTVQDTPYLANYATCVSCRDALGCDDCNETDGCKSCPKGTYAPNVNRTEQIATCSDCQDSFGCDSCTFKGCDLCPKGTYLNNLGSCVARPPACRRAVDGQGCTVCKPGFIRTPVADGTGSFNCTSARDPPFNCAAYGPTGCTACESDYYQLNITVTTAGRTFISCQPNPDYCNNVVDLVGCSRSDPFACAYGYFPTRFIVDGTTGAPAQPTNCTSCSAYFGCARGSGCSASRGCSRCPTDSYLWLSNTTDPNSAKYCKPAVGCPGAVQDLVGCTTCPKGTVRKSTPTGVQCVPCDIPTVGCTQCDDAGNGCTTCPTGYYKANATTPQTCSRCPPGCTSCVDGVGCTSCPSGFTLISATDGCASCAVYLGCSKCDSSGCLECPPGRTLNDAELCFDSAPQLASKKCCLYADSTSQPAALLSLAS